MNEEMEEIKQAVERYNKETKLKKAELLGIKFVTSEKDIELLKQLHGMFDLMDGWKKQKQEYQRTIVERKREEEKRGEEKVKFSVPIDFIDHKEYVTYETTRRGLDHFKHLMDPNKEERELDRAEDIPNLTFYDGVILVWEIIDRVIDEYFDEDEKDIYGQRYDLGLIDKIQDILNNEVLDKVENMRKKYLHDLFEIHHGHYA